MKHCSDLLDNLDNLQKEIYAAFPRTFGNGYYNYDISIKRNVYTKKVRFTIDITNKWAGCYDDYMKVIKDAEKNAKKALNDAFKNYKRKK